MNGDSAEKGKTAERQRRKATGPNRSPAGQPAAKTEHGFSHAHAQSKKPCVPYLYNGTGRLVSFLRTVYKWSTYNNDLRTND